MIAPHTFRRWDYSLQQGSFLRYRVQILPPNVPVGVYVLDTVNLGLLFSGNQWMPSYGAMAPNLHMGNFFVPFNGIWSLVIWNESDHVVDENVQVW